MEAVQKGNFFIWVINMFHLRKRVDMVVHTAVIFFSFVAGFLCWRLLSIGCAVRVENINSDMIDTILKCGYYYLTDVLLTTVYVVSEKQIITRVKK